MRREEKAAGQAPGGRPGARTKARPGCQFLSRIADGPAIETLEQVTPEKYLEVTDP